MLLATCVTPKDLPEPGEPKTASESGRDTCGSSMYCCIRLWMLRKLSISARSTVLRAPNCPTGTPFMAAVLPSLTMA